MNEFYNKLKYFEENEAFSPEIYYHYTSLEALFEIVRTHTFRLMSLKSSNDKKELCYNQKSFLNDLKRICNETENQDIKTFFKIVICSLEKRPDFFAQATKIHKDPYALCMARKKDNLTHWDRYANNCKGVCIAFNVAALKIHYDRMNSLAFGTSYFDIGKALYTQEDIDNSIIRSIAECSAILKDLCEKNNDPYTREFVEDRVYLFLPSYFENTVKFAKDKSFVDEDEVRLYHDANSFKSTLKIIDTLKDHVDVDLQKNIRKNFIELGNQFQIFEERFAMTKSGIRSYRNLCLDDIWGSGVIPEIIIGPQCVQNRNELQRFLKANGLEGTKVSISKVPIR